MESFFVKNLLRKENRPVLIVILAVFLFQFIFSAYLVLDLKRNKGENERLEKLPVSALSVKQEGSEEAKKEVKMESNAVLPSAPAAPQIQVAATDPKIKALIEKVFKHIFLPNGNVQVETVVKPDELRKINPVFYQMAKAGDQILEYSDRAILYDPVADKVLDVIHISK
ncbi:MAG: hypothetical protein HY983_01245 [Candidatus Magasanikbacteria bacterium]|nr:hypothetical protein [Candidatus Magasanikbacteria bacterium]